MTVRDIIQFIESFAPISYQEKYDNSGLTIGSLEQEIAKVLITLDVTESVVDEAIGIGANLIIAHHPLIFFPIKNIRNDHWIDRCITKSIKHDINIYTVHTNLDNVYGGVNQKIASLLGLKNCRILQPKLDVLTKLSFFTPKTHTKMLLEALYNVGVGHVGNYDRCSFTSSGIGTFRANEIANPTIGERGLDESCEEEKVEVLIPKHKRFRAIEELKKHHPYEEVSYYLSDLLNTNQEVGSGMIGELKVPEKTDVFISKLKSTFSINTIKVTSFIKETIHRVAICGGAGSFLTSTAIQQDADIFVTSDFKYHDFFEANDRIILADIGHYESEVATKDLLHELLTKEFTNFVFISSKMNTNPIKYL